MKLIIISTKQDHYYGLVQRCCCTKQFIVEDKEDNSVGIKYNQSGDFILCILPVAVGAICSEKSSYSMDLAKKTIIHFEEQVPKENIYLFLHSGDFFADGDGHRVDGVLKMEWLDTILSEEILTFIKVNVIPSHIRQFRHTTTEYVWRILDSASNENRCEKLLRNIK